MEMYKRKINGCTYAIPKEAFNRIIEQDEKELEPCVVYQNMENGNYIQTYVEYKEEVYKYLARFLFDKIMNKATYIKRMKRIQHYTHLEFQVYFNSGDRAVFILPAHF